MQSGLRRPATCRRPPETRRAGEAVFDAPRTRSRSVPSRTGDSTGFPKGDRETVTSSSPAGSRSADQMLMLSGAVMTNGEEKPGLAEVSHFGVSGRLRWA